MAEFQLIQDRLLTLDAQGLKAAVSQALGGGAAPEDILDQGLIHAMDIVGERMEEGLMFIPEVLMAAQAMSEALDLLKPLLGDSGSTERGRVIIGTVQGDLHDIGKNLVAMMMESAGLTVFNLGVDISPADFVREIQEKNANVLCLSALLTTTMPMMKLTVDAVVESGLRDQVKIMVGGAPVTAAFAEEIGADAFAPDAGSAAKQAKALMV